MLIRRVFIPITLENIDVLIQRHYGLKCGNKRTKELFDSLHNTPPVKVTLFAPYHSTTQSARLLFLFYWRTHHIGRDNHDEDR